MAEKNPYRIYLSEDQIPTAYYNLRADMPTKPGRMLLPNGVPAEVAHISPVFAEELCRQELDDETRYVPIPEGIREMYKIYRPSPLCRAYNLEQALGTPAKIYYKFEGNNTSGSHKLNSALAQAYYAYQQGLSTITTETGAGQWGTALSETAFQQLGEYPDVVVGCAGGGSNLGGLIAPFMRDKLTGVHPDTRFVAVEPASCPSLTRGRYAYDFPDTGRTAPLCKMYTLGNGFIPSPDHAGGLRFHGMAPILSQLKHDGYLEAVAVKQTDVFGAAELFAKLETILPAPESAHAILGAINEAKKCIETGEEKVILFGLTGTGYFDLTAYEAYNNGTMVDHVPTDEELEAGFATIPAVPGIQAEGGLPL